MTDSAGIPAKITKQWLVFDSFLGGYDGVAVGPDDSVYVAAPYTGSVRKIYPDRLPIDVGSGFVFPVDVAVDRQGNVYVADMYQNEIKVVYLNGSMRTIGSGFLMPEGVAVDSKGNVYVADTYHDAVKMILPNGTTVRIANVDMPESVAIDGKGNVYSVGSYGNVYIIYPNYTMEYLGNAGISHDIAVDASGNVYVSEQSNYVEVVFPDRTTAKIGRFSRPTGLTVDSQGNLFIVDANSVTELSLNSSGSIMPFINPVIRIGLLEIIFTAPIWVFVILWLISRIIKGKSLHYLSIAELYVKKYLKVVIPFSLIYIGISIVCDLLSLFPGADRGIPVMLFMFCLFGMTYSIISGTLCIIKWQIQAGK